MVTKPGTLNQQIDSIQDLLLCGRLDQACIKPPHLQETRLKALLLQGVHQIAVYVRGKLVPSLHDDVWQGLLEEAAVHALGGDVVLAMIDVLDLHGAADELGEDAGVVGVRVVVVLRADALGVGVATELVRVNVHVKLLLDLAGADGENVGLGDVEFHLVLVHHYRQVGILRIWFNSGNGLIPETYFSKRSNFERISVEGTTNHI